MKKFSVLTFLAFILLGFTTVGIEASYEPTVVEDTSVVFNFKTGEYEVIQPRAAVCYCGSVMDTFVTNKTVDTYAKPCIHGHPGYEDVHKVIHRVVEGRCPNCGSWRVISSTYLRTDIFCDWNI